MSDSGREWPSERTSTYRELQAQVEALQRESEQLRDGVRRAEKRELEALALVDELKAPVSDEEWDVASSFVVDGWVAPRYAVDTLITSRATQPAPQPKEEV